MGGEEERRSKKRRSSLSRSPSPSRDGGGSRKSGKRHERESKRSRKEEKREKRKRSKSGRSSRSGRDGKDESSREMRKHKRSSKPLDNIEQLSEDDYFLKNNEFSTWLKDEKGIFFSDLSSTEARKLFTSFVKVWNKGKLKSEYYEGIAKGPRTRHNWMIGTEK